MALFFFCGPHQDPDLVREVVGVSHGNFARVKELVTAQPSLARASWDWGFGDHESAIDAASHVGNRPIAEFLVAHGARPTIFTAAMLGQLAVVRGLIEALPGVQRMRGPHGITLLAHARAGGSGAAAVREYLERLGDADPVYTDLPVPPSAEPLLPGEYTGTLHGATMTFVVARNTRAALTIARAGVMGERNLFHQGALVFNPAGAEAVRIRFEAASGDSVTLLITDGPSSFVALRTRQP